MIYILFTVLLFAFLISLGIKWNIRLKIVIPWAFFMAFFGCLSLYFLDGILPDLSVISQLIIGFGETGIVTCIVILMLFYRDPERIPPAKENIILSPADGRVLYIKEINNGDFPFAVKGRKNISLKEFIQEDFITEQGIQIGIEMTYLHVHINRTPIKGKIISIKRIPGHFYSLKKISNLLENERVFTIIEGGDIKIGIVQIATRLVRRIFNFIKEEDSVEIGQRMGVIRFGSQVDILIPNKDNLNVLVKPHDEVKAGISIIATY